MTQTGVPPATPCIHCRLEKFAAQLPDPETKKELYEVATEIGLTIGTLVVSALDKAMEHRPPPSTSAEQTS